MPRGYVVNPAPAIAVRKDVRRTTLLIGLLLLAAAPAAGGRERLVLHWFSGRVVDAAGAPAAGVAVTVRSERGETVSGRTDADGRFVVRGTMSERHLCPCWWDVTAVAGADVGLSGRGCVGRTMRLDFGDVRLGPTRSLRVRVLGPGDEAVADAMVDLVVDGAGEDDGVGRPHSIRSWTTTDAEGVAAFAAVPAAARFRARITVSARGFAGARRDLGPVAEIGTSVVRLVPGRNVTGRIVDADGRPAVSLDVAAGRGTGNEWQREVGAATGPRTGRDGRFRVQDLPPREVVLAVGTRPGWNAGDPLAPVAVPVPDGEPGSETDLGEILLPPVVLLTGRVVDEEGDPVGAADVWVPSPDLPRLLGGARTDESGAFALRIPDVPGVLLRARGPDGRRGAAEPDPAGEGMTIVVVRPALRSESE